MGACRHGQEVTCLLEKAKLPYRHVATYRKATVKGNGVPKRGRVTPLIPLRKII